MPDSVKNQGDSPAFCPPSPKGLFFILSGLTFCFMLFISSGYGITWDEFIQSHYGKLVLRFLATGGSDKTCLFFPENMFLYGGLFDTLAVFIYGALFQKLNLVTFYDPRANFFLDAQLPFYFETRHALNAAFGFITIFFTGLTAKELKGWKTACFALVFMVFSPRFLGNAMNNPKDIPFAAAAAIAVYFMIRYLGESPKPKLSTKFGVAGGIAMAINVKVGGILFIGYFWLFTLVSWFFERRQKEGPASLVKLVEDLLLISAAAYFGGLIFWPYGLMQPLTHPLEVLKTFSSFSGAQGQMLFEGAIISQAQAPWHYLPKWLLISTPLFFLAGILFCAAFARQILKNYPPRILAILVFAALFPPAYAILKKSVIYDSWRHFLFVYPPLVILAAAGWEHAFDAVKTHWQKTALRLFLLVLFLHPLRWMMFNHPHEYVYFNPTVGGINGAYGDYETDYWGNCLRQSAEWLGAHVKAEKPGQPARITADGDIMSSAYYLFKSLGNQYVMVPKGMDGWQYRLALARGLTPEQLRGGQWPPPGTIHEIKADNVTLCAIVEKA